MAGMGRNLSRQVWVESGHRNAGEVYRGSPSGLARRVIASATGRGVVIGMHMALVWAADGAGTPVSLYNPDTSWNTVP